MSTEKERWAKLAGIPQPINERFGEIKVIKKDNHILVRGLYPSNPNRAYKIVPHNGLTMDDLKKWEKELISIAKQDAANPGPDRFSFGVLAGKDGKPTGKRTGKEGTDEPEYSFHSNPENLNENFVGIGMVGNIFDREKEQYEDAFEYFLAEKYDRFYDRFYEGDTYSITIDHPDAGKIFNELGFDYQGRAQRDGNSYIFELPEDLELFKSETEHIREGLEENYTTEVRDAWPSLSIDDRVSLLLTVFDDTDMAEELAEKDFDALPDAATSNMRMDMLEEGENLTKRERGKEVGVAEYFYNQGYSAGDMLNPLIDELVKSKGVDGAKKHIAQFLDDPTYDMDSNNPFGI